MGGRCSGSRQRWRRAAGAACVPLLAAGVAGCAGWTTGSAGAAESNPSGSSAAGTSAAASSAAGPSGTAAGSSTAGSSAAGVPETDVLTFTVVGDSITAGKIQDGSVSPAPGSWVPAVGGAPLEYVPGWAVSGATTEDMRRGVMPTTADVVVIMGGTNDLQRLPWEVTEDDLIAIATTVDADQVVLSAIPPKDPAPAEAESTNARLRTLAEEQGWEFFDPWTGFSVQGSYVAGASLDGVHPTVEVADTIGRRFRDELLSLR